MKFLIDCETTSVRTSRFVVEAESEEQAIEVLNKRVQTPVYEIGTSVNQRFQSRGKIL